MGTTPTPRLARARLSDAVLAGLVRRRQPVGSSREQALRHAEIRRLALALREAARALKANRTELAAIVNDLVPELTTRPGIGPVSAAQAIVSFSHAGRCRNDAAFATLAGTTPDRSLQRANHPPPTQPRRRPSPQPRHPHHRQHPDAQPPPHQDYLARRRTEGKSDREIRRCLKRYIARQLYRALTAAMNPNTTASA
jgi:hypothetical protein